MVADPPEGSVPLIIVGDVSVAGPESRYKRPALGGGEILPPAGIPFNFTYEQRASGEQVLTPGLVYGLGGPLLQILPGDFPGVFDHTTA